MFTTKQKGHPTWVAFFWRRVRDSNPRFLSESPVFKTGSLNRSDNSPNTGHIAHIIAGTYQKVKYESCRPAVYYYEGFTSAKSTTRHFSIRFMILLLFPSDLKSTIYITQRVIYSILSEEYCKKRHHHSTRKILLPYSFLTKGVRYGNILWKKEYRTQDIVFQGTNYRISPNY